MYTCAGPQITCRPTLEADALSPGVEHCVLDRLRGAELISVIEGHLARQYYLLAGRGAGQRDGKGQERREQQERAAGSA